jgi:simple sugar transport system substrate-binding protein
LAVLAALAAAIALMAFAAGCAQTQSDSGSAASTQPANSDLITIGFSQVGAESDWRIANTKSMRDTFTEATGYELILKDAQQKQENQIAAIRGFVEQKVDYIILAPVTETGWDEVLGEVKQAKIPIIILDRMIDVADESLYTCWLGSDFRSEGGTAVTWMEEYFGNQELKIAHVQGTMGSSAQIGRTEGLEEGVTKHSNWNIVSQDSGDFTEGEGKAVMERMLRETPDFNVVYCENDNMAFGVIKALEEAHIDYGTSDSSGAGTDPGSNPNPTNRIQIISFDATRAGLELTLKGHISFNMECNPLHGPRVKEIIEQLKAGNTPVKRSFVTEKSFDSTTITQAIIDEREY